MEFIKNIDFQKVKKSKTIQFNSIFLCLVMIAGAFGYNLPTEAIVPAQTLFNIVLRLITKDAVLKE